MPVDIYSRDNSLLMKSVSIFLSHNKIMKSVSIFLSHNKKLFSEASIFTT